MIESFKRITCSDLINILQSPTKANRSSGFGVCIRITRTALPFLTNLCKPLASPIAIGEGLISIGTNTLKIVGPIQQGKQNANKGTSYKLFWSFQFASSFAALTFARPINMVIRTGQDISIECWSLHKNVNCNQRKLAAMNILKIVNKSLYLVAITKGGIELTLASFFVRTITSGIQSGYQFSNDNWIEGVGDLGMTIIRGMQCKQQYEALQFKWMMEGSQSKDAEGEFSPEVIFTILQKLEGTLSKTELMMVSAHAQKGKILNPNCLWMFAKERGEKNSFNSLDIRTICETVGTYNSNWVGIEKQELFWQGMHENTFGNIYNYLPNENSHSNYEARRIIGAAHYKAGILISDVHTAPFDSETMQLVPKDFIAQMLQTSLIEAEKNTRIIQEEIWKQCTIHCYRNDKIFDTRSWEENFEIAHNTAAFSKTISDQYPSWGKAPFLNGEKLEELINKYPKTSKIYLRGHYNLYSPSIIKCLDKCKDTLKYLKITFCGLKSDDEDETWEAVEDKTITKIASCKHLESVSLKVHHLVDKNKAEQILKESCPNLYSLSLHK